MQGVLPLPLAAGSAGVGAISLPCKAVRPGCIAQVNGAAARVPLAARLTALQPASSLQRSSLCPGTALQLCAPAQSSRPRRQQWQTQAAAAGEVLTPPKPALPSVFWRVASAFFYVVPWIDCLSLGRQFYHEFPNTLMLYFAPSPFVPIYYSNQFAPLVIFFLLFLSIVRNTKMPHFVRFNCMQSIMLDIVVMLFTILRTYLPNEIAYTAVSLVLDKFSFLCCISTIVYCVFWALRGHYCDIPFVSESVYMQVEQSG